MKILLLLLAYLAGFATAGVLLAAVFLIYVFIIGSEGLDGFLRGDALSPQKDDTGDTTSDTGDTTSDTGDTTSDTGDTESDTDDTPSDTDDDTVDTETDTDDTQGPDFEDLTRKEQILKLLETKGPKTTTRLTEELGSGRTYIARVLNQLENEEKIEEAGTKGKETLYKLK